MQCNVKSLSRAQLFVTPWTVTYQALLSMGFSRQEYWSGLPFPSPGDLPDPAIKPGSPTLQADVRGRETVGGKMRGGVGPQSKCEEDLGMSTLMCTGAAFIQSLTR